MKVSKDRLPLPAERVLGGSGSFTFTIRSARSHTSFAVATTWAPACVYSSSAIPLPFPAPRSSRTVWPAWVSSRTAAGTIATRFSWALVSRGTNNHSMARTRGGLEGRSGGTRGRREWLRRRAVPKGRSLPSKIGLRRARPRLILSAPFGRLAQLARAPARQAGGRRFKSFTAHQTSPPAPPSSAPPMTADAFPQGDTNKPPAPPSSAPPMTADAFPSGGYQESPSAEALSPRGH